MHSVTYSRKEVTTVMHETLSLAARRGTVDDDNDHALHAFASNAADTADPSASTASPLLSSARTTLHHAGAGEPWTISALAAGVIPSVTRQLIALLDFSFIPAAPTNGRGVQPGLLTVTFDPGISQTPSAEYAFQVTASGQVIAKAPTPPVDGAGGPLDVLKCIVSNGAKALLPALATTLPLLAAGPEAFLPAAARAGASALPGAVLAATRCVSGDSPGLRNNLGYDVMTFPADTVQRTLGSSPTAPQIVCTDDKAIYAFGGKVNDTVGADPTSATGTLKGVSSLLQPVDVGYTVTLQPETILVTLDFQLPVTARAVVLEYDRVDGHSIPSAGTDWLPGEFDLACLVTASGGPMLDLIRANLAKLRTSPRAFLQGMIDGGGKAVGASLSNVIQQCVGGRTIGSQ